MSVQRCKSCCTFTGHGSGGVSSSGGGGGVCTGGSTKGGLEAAQAVSSGSSSSGQTGLFFSMGFQYFLVSSGKSKLLRAALLQGLQRGLGLFGLGAGIARSVGLGVDAPGPGHQGQGRQQRGNEAGLRAHH